MHRFFILFSIAVGFTWSATAAEIPAWRTALSTAHPLVGKIWRTDAAEFVAPAILIKQLTVADYVFLGEKHDNPDHHRLQAWILESLVAAGKRPAVVWEMIDEEKQAAIDSYMASATRDADGFGKAVDWDRSGWPAWQEYRPIAEIALASGLPMVAGNLPRKTVREIGRGGLAALSAARRARLGLDQSLSVAASDAMLNVVTKAHCDLMPRTALGPMVDVQRARDAVLADNLVRAKIRAGSAVLIAGGGHARHDFGAPNTVAVLAPNARIVTVTLIEVEDGETDPTRYASRFSAATLPFDFVWFTPRANDRDYCAELRERFKGHKKTK
ncbi:MAG: hypothetical protein GKS00_19805 [Alphaproteobacteria bacterium]|nr:hypothetical protein [Alphaproteobacteria bacterium]